MPITYEDYQEALATFGLQPDEKLTTALIQKKYRLLSKERHPDRHQGVEKKIQATEAFKAVGKAK